jgi:hypothetical protein
MTEVRIILTSLRSEPLPSIGLVRHIINLQKSCLDSGNAFHSVAIKADKLSLAYMRF